VVVYIVQLGPKLYLICNILVRAVIVVTTCVQMDG